MSNNKETVAIFVDGNNIFHSAKQLGFEINYRKLLEVLTYGEDYRKAVFYTGVDATAERQRGFLHWMNRNGWRVFKKEVKADRDGNRKAHLEVEIATDMLRSVMNGITEIVLVSGDEDFAYTLARIQELDVRVTVAGYREAMSNKLLDVADVYIDLGAPEIDIKKVQGETEED